MKAGSATHASTTQATQSTTAEASSAKERESFAISLAKSLAPSFETVVHVDVPADSGAMDRHSRGGGSRSDEPAEASTSADEHDASASTREAPKAIDGGEPEAVSIADASPSFATERAAPSVEASPSAVGLNAGVRPAAIEHAITEATPEESYPGSATPAGSGGDQDDTGAKVAVARDPLGLMPQPEPVYDTRADAGARESAPKLAEMQEQRRSDPRLQTNDSGEPAGTTASTRGAAQPGAGSTVMPGALPGMMLGPTPVAASGGPRMGVQGPVNGLSGLTSVGRPGIWKLEHAAKPQVAGARSDPEAQVARAMVAALRHKGGVVTLRLSPDDLGPVRVELRVEDGRVSATIDAQDDRTRGALHSGLDSLRKSLEASGLSVDRLDVVGTVGLGSAPADTSSRPQEHDHQPSREHDPEDRPSDSWSGSGGQGGREREHGFEREDASESPDEGTIDLAWSLRTLRLDTVV